MLYAAYASRTENQDAIDMCVVNAIPDPAAARIGIKLLDFKPFNPTDKRTEITYTEDATGNMKRVTKGMTGIIIELCTRNKTEEIESQLETDVEEFAARGLRALAVAYEDVPSGDKDAEGTGFELIGLLAIYDPPREDTKQTIDDAQALGVKVKMVTGDQLAIAKETGRRLGLGDHVSISFALSLSLLRRLRLLEKLLRPAVDRTSRESRADSFSRSQMYPAKVLKAGGFPEGGKHLTLDEMILDADGFAGVFPEHKYEIVKRLQGLGHLVAMVRLRFSSSSPFLLVTLVAVADSLGTNRLEMELTTPRLFLEPTSESLSKVLPTLPDPLLISSSSNLDSPPSFTPSDNLELFSNECEITPSTPVLVSLSPLHLLYRLRLTKRLNSHDSNRHRIRYHGLCFQIRFPSVHGPHYRASQRRNDYDSLCRYVADCSTWLLPSLTFFR